MQKFITLFIITTAVSFLLTIFVFAETTQQVVFTFVNGGGLVNNINFFVYFPENVRPVNLTSRMIWNPINKTLTIAVDKIESNQTLSLAITIAGPTGDYTLKGQLIGQWAQIGQNFQSDLIAVETKIRKTGRSETIVETIRSNPKVIAAAKNVVVPAAVAFEVASAGALTGSAVSANATLAVKIAEMLRFLRFIGGFGFLQLRRRKPWGRVYNQLTQKAIKSATVRIFEATFQKLKDTQFTDKDGRFGFLVSPGKYYLSVLKPGFLEIKTELINIKGTEEALNISVALFPEVYSNPQTKMMLKVLKSIFKIINKINPLILILGTLAGIGVAIILPTTFNFIVLGVYLLIDGLKIILSKATLKSFGQVIDKKTRLPLALAVVRLFDAEKSWLLTSQVSDGQGRFKFLLVPGNYYITCAKGGYKSFISPSLPVSRAGLLTWDIILESEA